MAKAPPDVFGQDGPCPGGLTALEDARRYLPLVVWCEQIRSRLVNRDGPVAISRGPGHLAAQCATWGRQAFYPQGEVAPQDVVAAGHACLAARLLLRNWPEEWRGGWRPSKRELRRAALTRQARFEGARG